ncbi:anti-repressor SinI family protein [Priestia megaterium]|nr:anti-repressor SinI family protein [Priestia megaterium]MDW4512140.1 anti-repressor SinI family protein [Priestia megaterium]PEC41706.1 SinR repressor domain-containing protein dimerization [Priestia megaterium]
MSSENEITMSNVDQEWINLIHEAKEIGLSLKEVKAFLDNKQT